MPLLIKRKIKNATKIIQMIQLTILVKIYTGLEELLLLHAGTEVSEGNPW